MKIKSKTNVTDMTASESLTSACPPKKKGLMSKKRGELIFLTCLLAVPILHFCVFYIGVNFNSILLAFKQYDGMNYNFAGFVNFKRFF